ncbi:MAG: tetratricopeptide repeat protein [Phycisphaeraceae bacterium]|nr:tetratricopeptide repeat protein [Phycisphaeraceae bacterium]
MRKGHPVGALLLALAGSIVVSGCASPRPVDRVRESGDHHFDRGEYREAAAEYREIVDRYPGDWMGQYRYGLSLLELREYEAARRALKVATDRRPADPDLADAYAEALFRAEAPAQLFAFLRDRAEQTGSSRAWMRLARYAAESGDPDTARLAIDTAIAVDPESSTAPYLLAADLAEAIGDVDLSVRRLRQALWIDVQNDAVNTRLRALGHVPGPTFRLPPGR